MKVEKLKMVEEGMVLHLVGRAWQRLVEVEIGDQAQVVDWLVSAQD